LADRPYKAFGFPVLPIIYIVMGIAFCSLLIWFKPQYTWPGMIIAMLGIPIYFFTAKKTNQ
jgi:APA family basic amino acid/polyamine antiporter